MIELAFEDQPMVALCKIKEIRTKTAASSSDAGASASQKVDDFPNTEEANVEREQPQEESLAQQFALDDIMNPENVFPPNEGTTGSIGQENRTSKYMEDLSTLWETKESFVLIDNFDPDTAAMLGGQVQDFETSRGEAWMVETRHGGAEVVSAREMPKTTRSVRWLQA